MSTFIRNIATLLSLALWILLLSSCSSSPLKQGNSITRFAIYGNWCGPNYPKEMNTAALPIDNLDASCMHHDMCYAAQGNYACECDKIIIEELETNLLMGKYSANQTYYAHSFHQYFRSSWCNGTPDGKADASKALHTIYLNTSQTAASFYDYILGDQTLDNQALSNQALDTQALNNQEPSANNETAPVTTSQDVLKKK